MIRSYLIGTFLLERGIVMEELDLQAMLEEIRKTKAPKALQDLRIQFLGKKSALQAALSQMGKLPPEERASFGQKVNMMKKLVAEELDKQQKILDEEAIRLQLASEEIDLTLPGEVHEHGSKSIINAITDEIIDILIGMGYEVKEGPEVETDHYNFEMLNVPKDHPARDMQDSFYITENLLLRTQTSPVQARTMLERNGVGPIKMICPGKVYRRDDDDATHSHQFTQIEGLVIDEHITMADLKGTLELLAKRMFGEKREIRFRSSFFPFTEPSVEVDVSCFNCDGKGCNICKGTGWIEILGAGMVHPNVLRMGGFDPDKYTGFAFGIGVERIAMLRYGISDIRHLYSNDKRVVKQFVKEG